MPNLSPDSTKVTPNHRISLAASIPFFICHLMPFAAIWTGVTWLDVMLCISLYWARMFFITAGYHRYFSHRSYQMGRVMQFLMAFGGTMAAQKGVLWWAAHHRHHHRYSDQAEDLHSPKEGFWWSHVGWILSSRYNETRFELIPDFAKYPELRWLNKYQLIPPILLAIAITLIGGWSALWIGFFLSTVLLWHGTFFINSLAHVFGRRRFVTTDTSRNSFLLAFITMGEGWHNNHHHFQASANQGFYWWEFDASYYVLKLFSKVGLAWKLKKPPQTALQRNLIKDGNLDIGMLKEIPAKAALALSQAKRRAADVIEEISTPVNLASEQK